MHRRGFLSTAAGVLASANHLDAAPGDFTFVHFTDPHIQPELKGDEATIQAFRAINKLKPDFCLAGGDLVFDVFERSHDRAKLLFDMYARALKELQPRVYSAPGNHDVFGISIKSGVPPADPLYGKKLFEDRIGARYSSFTHKGWHFIQLDSIGITAERGYRGFIDEEQMDWLRKDLTAVGRSTPIVVTTHIPLVTGFGQYVGVQPERLGGIQIVNGKAVIELFQAYTLKAVLQGHTHIREQVEYNGCQFITSGAVSGNWWRGLRFGHPEGFGLVTIKGGKLNWEYRTFGWKAVTPA
jgi:3',5'-cyclic-AMP phosphodiesterase